MLLCRAIVTQNDQIISSKRWSAERYWKTMRDIEVEQIQKENLCIYTQQKPQ